MFGLGFNVAKCETTCRLAIGRFKLIRNKKNIQIKQSRKEIAELLRSGKQEYARIRVEGVIRENLLQQAYEILELYLELITQRTQLIAKTKEIPRDMIEAVSSIIYAAQRVSDLPELLQLRSLLAAKYGKEYAAEAAADATASKWQVNHNLIRCLLVEPPQPEEKLATLSDIAQEHGIEWDLSSAARDMAIMTPSSTSLSMHAAAVPPAPIPAVPNSIGAPHGHGQGGAGGFPPAGGNGGGGGGGQPQQFSNAQQAAQVAAALAAQAKAAADYAAQFVSTPAAQLPAAGQYGGAHAAPPPAPGWMAPPDAGHMPPPPFAGGPMPGFPGGAAPPPPPHYAHPHGGIASQPSDHSSVHGDGVSYRSSGGGASEHSAASNTPSAAGAGAPGVQRSLEDVQRAYDAALGPPTKGEIPSTPSADHPSAPPQQQAPSPAPAPAAPLAPPKAPTPPAVADEYDELTKRLEALKRS